MRDGGRLSSSDEDPADQYQISGPFAWEVRSPLLRHSLDHTLRVGFPHCPTRRVLIHEFIVGIVVLHPRPECIVRVRNASLSGIFDFILGRQGESRVGMSSKVLHVVLLSTTKGDEKRSECRQQSFVYHEARI